MVFLLPWEMNPAAVLKNLVAIGGWLLNRHGSAGDAEEVNSGVTVNEKTLAPNCMWEANRNRYDPGLGLWEQGRMWRFSSWCF